MDMDRAVRERQAEGPLTASQPANLGGWLSVASGSALAVFGITRRSIPGVALAAAGGYLIYEGVSDLRQGENVATMPLYVEKTATINRSIEEVYQFWHRVENYPRFMRFIDKVEPLEERKYRWTGRGPLGFTTSWDVQITDDLPNEAIVWRSLPEAAMQQTGQVRFRKAPGDRGTEVRVRLDFRPVLGNTGKILRSLFGLGPEQVILEDLRRAKQLLEAGEVITTIGQPEGPRGTRGRLLQALYREHPLERRKGA